MEVTEEFVKNMDRFIDIFMEDREDSKRYYKETTECLTKIKTQLTRLETQSISDEKISDERRIECTDKHKEINEKLINIPTEKEKKNTEDRIFSLEKLKPKFYMILGGLSLLAIIGPLIAKQLGWI